MNRYSILLALLFLVLACEKETSAPLNTEAVEGSWVLVEVLFDPGDGSGTFEPSDAGFEITLNSDNTFEANFHVCRVFEEGNRNTGAFTRIGGQEVLIPCSGSILNGIQGRLESGHLVFYYPCVEPCIYKFRKTADLRE
jgi:hypothetical protein